MSSAEPSKKLLENKFLGGLIVPIAIVLVGSLIIFGVTKMLSTERSYKDLVREIQSKTFGNRWVAAYELSKVISTSQVPEAEKPWLVANLAEVYDNAADPRTRDFIVVAVGSLKTKEGLPLLEKALDDKDKNAKFHAIVALGNYPEGTTFNWSKVERFLDSDDFVLQQSSALVMGSQKVRAAVPKLIGLLSSENLGIRYAAASALIPFKSNAAVNTIKEILQTDVKNPPKGISANEIIGLKLSTINALLKNNWSLLNNSIRSLIDNESNPAVISKAREALNQLKK